MGLESNDGREQAASLVQPMPNPSSGVQIPCPRCDSTNTKFCYYNNYNLSQPRHFCKSCRRYWTHGGALRNVPVGGGTRKSSSSKRSRSTLTVSPPRAASSPSSSPALTMLDPNASIGLHGEGFVASTHASSLLVRERGFGYGPGHYDSGVGLPREGRGHMCCSPLGGGGYLGHADAAGSSGVHNTWQLLSDLGMGPGGAAGLGVGDGLTWPGLAISTPWNASSK